MKQRDRTQWHSLRSKSIYITVILGVILLSLTPGIAAADSEAEVIIEQNATDDSTVTYDIVVQNASDGVNGFEFNVSLNDDSEGNITDASLSYIPEYADVFGTGSATVAANQKSASFDAVYLTEEIANNSRTTIATVEISQSGSDILSLESNIDDTDNRTSGIASINGQYTVTRVPWHDGYTDENAVVQAQGLNTAVRKYLNGDLSASYLNEIISSYLSKDSIESL